ncbi:DUF1080 domain-containing protein [uncultured Sunxiuqinia sp.]|uniref:3-keto-disaccharide hydrolase n=1 Tax=uncultured Sunxiuqinia sp. TaxID=1573825 RepID=UPI0030DBEB80|tara:strand:+ start:4501 stop:5307 length:807 start_codon:yes stop_codon:yes gene_type:complete
MKKLKLKKRGLLFLVASIFFIGACQTKEEEKGWIQLFNGKDLNDWQIKIAGHDLGENYNNTFRVEDGLLKVRYDQYETFNGEFAHLFYKQDYSHYKMRIEYRFVGEQVTNGPGWAFRNSGIMIHGQSAESMEKNQDFPTSIEVQLLGGNGTDERSNMNLCTPGTNVVMDGELVLDHCINSSSRTFHGDGWVTAEIEVCGDSIIKHIVDGQVVMQYMQPQLDERDATYQRLLPPDGNKLLKGGSISLQGESHPIDFRKVELLNLGDDCE